MKHRFNALDIKAVIYELKNLFLGCRVANIYDVDHKTYLIKLTKPDSKAVILIESGIRIHSTEFEIPKNIIPSGFSMKLRKHLRSRRLENIRQVGADRIVDFQFGSNEAAYHLIVELYDRGNILLTDYEYTIITVLRPRTDENSDVKFTVRETYPLELAKNNESLTMEKLNEIFTSAKDNEDVKKLLTSHLTFGGPLIEHCMALANFPEKCLIGKNFDRKNDLSRLFEALNEAEKLIEKMSNEICQGFIIQKKTKAPKLNQSNALLIQEEDILTYDEFHPFLFRKNESSPFLKFDSFNKAVDEFFSQLETQKLEMKEIQQNKEAIKKLENVKKDHEKRIEELKSSQMGDEMKAKLIEYNLDLVDQAIYLINNAIANQLDWKEIEEIIEDAKEEDHPIASVIQELHLDTNHIKLKLNNPEYDDEDEDDGQNKNQSRRTTMVDIDLALTAFKNSRKYYENKKNSFIKEKKTFGAHDKALKSAEKRTIEILKQSQKSQTITKARKPFWFEKFYWFISSENYMVIGGRDQQQNELIVKRYLKTGDLYVHADLHGASSVIIKNPSGGPVPPKTLNEAGCMAVCYSVAWEAKVIARAYWVYNHQVSKQAPSGEYLTTGSFMIKGEKNFIIDTSLIFGFGLLFKLEETSVFRHKNERKVKSAEEDLLIEKNHLSVEFEDVQVEEEEVNEELNNEFDNENKKQNNNLETLSEETNDESSNNNNKKESLPNIENRLDDNDDDGDEASQYPDTSFQMKIVSDLTDKNKLNSAILPLNETEGDKEKDKDVDEEKSSDDDDDDEVSDNDDDDDNKDDNKIKANDQTELSNALINSNLNDSAAAAVSAKDNKTKKNLSSSELNKTKNVPQPQQQPQQQQKSNKQQPLKKGQKARLNKMKTKYKDQDDEDREIVMKYLAPAGKSTDSKQKDKKSNKKQHFEASKQANSGTQQGIKKKPTTGGDNEQQQKQQITNDAQQQETQSDLGATQKATITSQAYQFGIDADEETQTQLPEDEANILDSLTGIPHDEDELLFCLPVCAPYNALQNYKYKVKLNPGSSKKGQAVKTAFEIFIRDRQTTLKEKELIRPCVSKAQEFSRNFPGKVKVSAPNLIKIKKK